ncbi:ABC transporter substrate-binding protein [Bradyrhizobium sp. U87765 SZCCT0131]|uniref:ABC transporter substrate-binding protein n=1 Tax=unclassified Bradyrhizobium TaxID=2631580 RepID=UPI001BAC372F|nr:MULTISPECIES: ABC transporter substrate-binding protein [unclassified Bradyrhizobium]MBR1222216.1 ABC transporter substrate-binding protein [Bradyrhizobium sp. U87765 SZCCT0131]MBR1264300.1 ABC transporter substrate-binding protein [Bradyrhizobium sp. U87765 SZCCT0134]MBR1307917.1 ABC transporter substrate-binding protein [Bradyrhizobium sp. U87765 SZCCT0110]MBR1320550.1 ABC transporter substrate-binding protein [Bradyrhizobium sp. U87765 SZCCT0109]MBR1348337.1 ABC transporter substrate-bin
MTTIGKIGKRLLGAVTLLASLTSLASAQAIEKPDLILGVGGKSLLYYLPLTLTERLGYFKEEGLNVTITDFGGGAKALQSLIGGSADVVTGAYEHTIRMQAKGQEIAAVLELGRFPGIVLGVRKDRAAGVKSFRDLKGMKIGVTAPGSSTNFFVNALIAREGLKADDVAIIGVGAGMSAVAAMKKGDIDAMSNLDPVMTKLEQDGDIAVLADTRTEEGNMKLFGGNNPAAVVYLKRDFIAKYPVTTQHIVNAFYKSLKWLAKATPEDVARTVPEEYYLGDKALYLASVKASAPMYSRTGVIPPEGMKNALDMLLQFDPELKDARIDLPRTFDGRFVAKAAAEK